MGSIPEIDERQQEFIQLLDQHHRGLFAFVYSLVQHHADAEDVYQQAVLVLWRKFDDFELGTNFGAWSAQVARNTALDFLKSKRRRGPCLSEEFLELMNVAYLSLNRDASFFSDRAEALEECMKKLPEKDRDLVKQCYAPDRKFTQIAKERNRSVDAIYQTISRIRKSLARCVQFSLSSER